MILPLLPIWAEQLTNDPFVIICLSSAYSLAQFVCAPIWGRLSDKIGRRPIIVTSLLGGSLAYFGMAFAHAIVPLFIIRTLQGVCTAGGLAAAPAFIADVTTPEERSKGMGMIGAAFGLGFIFGPVMGAELARINPEVPFFAAGALSGLNFLWALARLPETHPDHTKSDTVRDRSFEGGLAALHDTLHQPLLVFLLALLVINTFAFSNLESTFTLFLQRHFHLYPAKRAVQFSGETLAYVGVIAVIVQGGLIGRLTRKFGERKLLVFGILSTSLGMLLIPFPHTVIGMLGVLTLVSAGVGLSNPSTQSLISRSAPNDRQGGVMGLSQGLASLARIAGPIWGGWTFKSFGIAWPYWTGGAILGLSFIAAASRLLIINPEK